MSGSAGGNRIKREDIKPTLYHYQKNVLDKITEYQKSKITGSYKYSRKNDFGDIDLIVYINSKNKKEAKKILIEKFNNSPDDTIIPFKSEKYRGKKYLNTGEIITILYPIIGKKNKYVQIDNIISLSENELDFKDIFLTFSASVQGLILGLVKTVCIEKDYIKLFEDLNIKNIPELKQDQEFEFNLSSCFLTLRLVTLEKNYKETDRIDIWKSVSWKDVEYILNDYNLNVSFSNLLRQIKNKLKCHRSKNRVRGIFKSMVSIKTYEWNTSKGNQKQKSLNKINELN